MTSGDIGRFFDTWFPVEGSSDLTEDMSEDISEHLSDDTSEDMNENMNGNGSDVVHKSSSGKLDIKINLEHFVDRAAYKWYNTQATPYEVDIKQLLELVIHEPDFRFCFYSNRTPPEGIRSSVSLLRAACGVLV
ncbi:uncharacterized protein CC84DRAFT_1211272 [Paraphaeosphaeria sporulosa]|uniref:Uncharacterized protein n=1 Tax=Paraphaeosphaeria sporulosa TaxID=1460663 RepID=A0A177CX47_9PLEO|nr:uncharacterized protein CC84DRAFT_1211272 [Paraphaeosphaeria sporulosa]OAG11618.1 hypothetical protein CC84DRAFT_1211272 [Paraphaeosphaeria sporulosa]